MLELILLSFTQVICLVYQVWKRRQSHVSLDLFSFLPVFKARRWAGETNTSLLCLCLGFVISFEGPQKLSPGASSQLQKVFLPPGTCFLRQNFLNIEEEFS